MNNNGSNNFAKLPERVLVVDDHPTNRKLLRATLEAEGVGVVEAADGLEALTVLEHETVEAVISDILMPNMDGYQLCHELRRNLRFSSLPLIVYTNTYTSPGDRELALTVGADEYVTKPATASEICAALIRAKDKSARRAMGAGPFPSTEFVMKKYANLLIHKLEKKNIQLEAARLGLEERVRERTAQLEAANKELDSFCHSVSHDLRAPLRHISGFAQALGDKCRKKLAPDEVADLDRVIGSAKRMGELIDDLLALSFASRMSLDARPVDLSALACKVATRLRDTDPLRPMEMDIKSGITVTGDVRLLLIVLENLLGNAWKFTSRQARPRIEVGSTTDPNGRQICFVRDNGVGFDMQYAGKLFGTFQRLHGETDFPGTGIGLATVQRIINRHGGKIWAEAQVNEGATFLFTLANHDNITQLTS